MVSKESLAISCFKLSMWTFATEKRLNSDRKVTLKMQNMNKSGLVIWLRVEEEERIRQEWWK
jgi:hypothetical protein